MAVKFSSSLLIAAPPERVFDAIVDVESFGEWMPNFVRVDRLEDGPLRVGSEFRETRRMMKREATEQFEVTQLQRPSLVGLRVDGRKGTTGKGLFDFLYRIEPHEGGSRLTMEGEIEMPGIFFKLFAKLLAVPFRKGCEADLRRLGAWVESKERKAA